MNIKKNLTLDDFKEMSRLEKMFYDEDHIAPSEEVQLWYEKFPHAGIVMEDEGKIIGFTDVFPIKDYIFEELKKGTFNDKNLEAEDIADLESMKPGDKTNMFIGCILILPEYRKTSALYDMLKAHVEYYDQFAKKGIIIENIIADAVSEAGQRYGLKIGFKKVIDTIYDSIIYMQPYADYVKNFK